MVAARNQHRPAAMLSGVWAPSMKSVTCGPPGGTSAREADARGGRAATEAAEAAEDDNAVRTSFGRPVADTSCCRWADGEGSMKPSTSQTPTHDWVSY